ncbi:MAG: hypothetical protein AAF447_14710 [Myxococcota bacterium]
MERWNVLPHEREEMLADNLWRVVGDLPGGKIRRQMVVARAGDGRLLLHNAICCDDALLARLEAWGEPCWLVVPGGWHRLDAKAWKARYPALQVLCPLGARARVEEAVPVDASYASFEPTDALELRHLRGVGNAEGVLLVRSPSGMTLVFNDVLFHQPHVSGAVGFLYRLLGQTGKPRVPHMAKRLIVDDRKALATHLRQLADTPQLVRALPAHIDPIEGDVSAALRAVADTL